MKLQINRHVLWTLLKRNQLKFWLIFVMSQPHGVCVCISVVQTVEPYFLCEIHLFGLK